MTADRQFYAAAYARDDGMRAGFEYFKIRTGCEGLRGALNNEAEHAIPCPDG